MNGSHGDSFHRRMVPLMRRKRRDSYLRGEQLLSVIEDERGAKRIAAEAADRFRDVVSEVLGLDVNPGDDELVRQLRELHGKAGPEPRRWRDFLTGQMARMENGGVRWRTDAVLDGHADA